MNVVNRFSRHTSVPSAAHQIGIWWHERVAGGWKTHEIDTSFSQTHATCMADINGDGPMLRTSQECRILIANPEVAGMGLDLTFANLEIFASNWYKPDTRIQAEDRLHRIGQHNPVTIIDLVAKNTMEMTLLKNTREKIDVENMILTHQQLFGVTQ